MKGGDGETDSEDQKSTGVRVTWKYERKGNTIVLGSSLGGGAGKNDGKRKIRT